MHLMSDINKKTNSNNHFKDLFLLFSIPIAVAVIAALIIYTPRLLANPTYDFIYSLCYDYSCKDSFSVDSSGKIILTPLSSGFDNYGNSSELRYYTASDDSTRSITLEESKQYSLYTSSKSRDGYTLTSGSTGGGFLFGGGYDDSQYLKNGAKKKKVELTTNGSYYSNNIKFLGWVNK